MPIIDTDKLTDLFVKETGIQNISTMSRDNIIIFYFGDDFNKSMKEILLSYMGLSRDEIMYLIELSEDDIKNMKKIIRIKQLKKELEELEKDVNTD